MKENTALYHTLQDKDLEFIGTPWNENDRNPIQTGKEVKKMCLLPLLWSPEIDHCFRKERLDSRTKKNVRALIVIVSVSYMADRIEIPDFVHWQSQIYILSALVTPVERECLYDSIYGKVPDKVIIG